MQVFVFVLNRTEHLEHLLQEFSNHGLRGATVLDSKGMARILLGSDAAAANLLVSDTAANPSDKVPYPCAILKTSISTGAAQNFLSYLRGNGARGIFESLGFEGADTK